MKKSIAKKEELGEGEMMEVEVEGEELLLCNIGGEFYAIRPKCTHFGGPLSEGTLRKGRIRCPWHQACFDAVSGELEEPPAIDSLPGFDVSVEDGEILVEIPDNVSDSRLPEIASHEPSEDERTFVIIGAGASGHSAAESLRHFGFKGRLVMITKEDFTPYDRTQLTKIHLAENKRDAPLLREREFYDRHDIQIITGRKVTSLLHSDRKIKLENGDSLTYDKALLATGGKPRELKVPGSELKAVLTLRSIEDANRINSLASKSDEIVIVGASFVGMEAAGSLTERGLSVTVTAPETLPYENTLGEKIGQMYKHVHEENGVEFRLKNKVKRFEGGGSVDKVVLEDGTELEADLVLMGVGIEPVTDYLSDVGTGEGGSVRVDENLKVQEDLYAAGDIVRFPDPRDGQPVRIEHWRLAQQHGRVAGLNMAGEDVVFSSIPFFWTRQYGFSLQYVGHCEDWDDVIHWGDVPSRDFIAFFVEEGEVRAAAGCGNGRDMAAIAELMEAGDMPSVEEIEEESVDLLEELSGP